MMADLPLPIMTDLPTHGQALILAVIREHEWHSLSGHQIRSVLALHKQPIEGPRFYQFMDRLERLGYVTSRYWEDESKSSRTRLYSMTATGWAAMKRVFDFYKTLEEMAS